jgi:acyl-CoA reductase-like NAD-dependent aldehyde dehydrogenase/uncharacterized protein (DUF2141 family)
MNRISAEERMDRARDAQQAWAALPLAARTSMLARLRRKIAAARDSIVEASMQDTGKPQLDALSGDVLVTLEQMLFYERNAARILAPRKVGKSAVFYRGATFHEQFEPHGVALIYGPANYPFQLAMVPAITALYAGNAVMLKFSERAPAVARIVEELCSGTLPAGLLQVVQDDPADAAAYIDFNPNIVFFTGSSANGRKVAARAAAQLVPTVLELGGKDAALVFADCNLERTVEGVVYGAFSHAGQVCVGIKRLYVEQAIYGVFLERLLRRLASLRIGSGHDCDFGALRSEAARQLLKSQVEEALAGGAKLETPGTDSLWGDSPIVLSNVPAGAHLLTDESFGPVLCVQPFSTEAEAISFANGSAFALSASVWTRNMRRARRIASALHTGSCAINDVVRNIANPHAAFGGNAASGYGRNHGPHGLLAFSRVKTVMAMNTSRRREINWFPFTRGTYKGLDTLIELRHRPHGLFNALRRLFIFAFISALLASASAESAARQGHLWLKVDLPPNTHVAIAYLVFSSPEGYPQDITKATLHGFFYPQASSATVQFDAGSLPPGRYAASIYLDENGNRKLDFGFLGIPKEPVGASNNPKSRMGPPRFDDCAFDMSTSDKILQIKLVKPK